MAKRFSVTLTRATPVWGSVVVPSGFTRRSLAPRVAESGIAIQRVPAGIDPTACPFPSSVTNSSPLSAPPSTTLCTPTARATRSSGSPPPLLGVGAAPGCGHPSAARARTVLASARVAEGRIQLFDREVDIRIGVGARDKSRFERGGREEDAAGERRLVPACKERRVGPFGIGVVANGARREVHAPHRTG